MDAVCASVMGMAAKRNAMVERSVKSFMIAKSGKVGEQMDSERFQDGLFSKW